MRTKTLSSEEVGRVRDPLIHFLKKYSDGRITAKGIRWFRQLPINEVRDGNWVAISWKDNKIAGAMIMGDYGRKEAMIVVHPDFRKHGIGETLLNQALQQLGKVYTRVACDNIPSLKLCFSCGLKAFHLVKGPTGKPTLWLGGGNFVKEDVVQPESIS
ncbi:GNAT family N-acetyltransferase [Baia soyae]|uniref:Acetyltransferase (GNAT) family protein n=1 Tax=Baia soyae TaxID=1544746 RepID=A0A4R2RXT5_9BACL|nr:GNAT family N-acetyltransferase [Baia soyae]TCP68363.1 acetyltransferase (GNAT) family protein [Baia soyae]